MDFIADLRNITEQAIKDGEDERQRREAEKKVKEERKREREAFKARQILDKIPQTCQLEASKGKNYAIVMTLGGLRGDYEYGEDRRRGGVPNELFVSELRGTARIVYDELNKIFPSITLEYWYSGDGMNSGYNIVCHW